MLELVHMALHMALQVLKALRIPGHRGTQGHRSQTWSVCICAFPLAQWTLGPFCIPFLIRILSVYKVQVLYMTTRQALLEWIH